MDVRKLISFGKGSFVVSVPKGWVNKNHLKKGDLISWNDEGTDLVMTPSSNGTVNLVSETTIEAQAKSMDFLKTEIVSAYLNCFDTITIVFDKNFPNVIKVKEIIRNLSGLEIMEQTSTKISAKNLISINEISIKNIIRRMDVIARAMMEDAMNTCRGECNYDNIYQRDEDVNRLYFLGSRVIKTALKNPRIAKMMQLEPWQLNVDKYLLLRLETISDKQKRVARYICSINLDRTSLEILHKIYSEVVDDYNNVMKSYYNQDKKLAIEVESSMRKRTKNCDNFLQGYLERCISSKKKIAPENIVLASKIVENMKSFAITVRNMARAVLVYE